MRGEFIGVWTELWDQIWRPLVEEYELEGDIFCELYRELDTALTTTFTAEQLADIIDDPAQAEEAFQNATPSDLKGCLLYTSPSPRDRTRSRMPSSA